MKLHKLWLYFCYSNLKEASAQLLGFNIEMMRYLPLLLKYSTAPLADNEWDFLMCSMLAWLEVIWKHPHFQCTYLFDYSLYMAWTWLSQRTKYLT